MRDDKTSGETDPLQDIRMGDMIGVGSWKKSRLGLLLFSLLLWQ